MQLVLSILPDTYAVCRLKSDSAIPKWAFKGRFFSITRTKDELSIVCREDQIGAANKVDRGWRMIKVEGPLDLSLIGIMANLSSTLAKGKVSVFVVSTYETDYILVKQENLEKSATLLSAVGHIIQ